MFKPKTGKPIFNIFIKFITKIILNPVVFCLIYSIIFHQSIALLDFPACVIGDPPEMTAEALEASTGNSLGANTSSTENGGGSPTNSMEVTTSFCCWRNMYSCVNLLRILNKLCKWKHSRIMMLVVFKSAPILKRTLKVFIFNLYFH